MDKERVVEGVKIGTRAQVGDGDSQVIKLQLDGSKPAGGVGAVKSTRIDLDETSGRTSAVEAWRNDGTSADLDFSFT